MDKVREEAVRLGDRLMLAGGVILVVGVALGATGRAPAWPAALGVVVLGVGTALGLWADTPEVGE